MDDLAEWYGKIYLRGDTWHRDYTFPGQARTRGSLHTRNREEAARKVRTEWQLLGAKAIKAQLLAAGGVVQKEELEPQAEVNLTEALARYMEEHGDKLPSVKSLRAYNKMLIEILGGDTLLSVINRAMVVKLRQRLEKRMVHYVDGDRPMSETQINHHIKHLRAVMRRAAMDWDVNASPHTIKWAGSEGVMLAEPDYVRRIIEDDAEEALIRETLDEDTRPLFDFSLEVGVRAENAFSLLKTQVNRSKGYMEFRVKSRKRDRRSGGSGKILRIPITEPVAKILDAVWDDHPTHVFTYICRKHFTGADKETGEKIVRRAGRRYPFTVSVLEARWNEVREKLGVKELTWHGLRATFATRLLDDGEPLHIVRDLLGHAKITTTEKYAVVREHKKREVLERAAQRKRFKLSRLRHKGKRPLREKPTAPR